MHNIIKKTVAGLLAVLLLMVSPACSIPENNMPVIYANTYNGRKQDCNTVVSCQKNRALLLVLPSDTDYSSLKLWCEPAGKVSINGEQIKNGEVCPLITADGTYELTSREDSYRLTIISSRNVPTIFIETESGSLDAIHADKAYKEAGRMAVYENGELTISTKLDYIKGRGNQTWKGEKRPYNIKFPEKISLLGMDAAKKWCLLANVPDDTLIRNTVALTLAQRMEIPYACDCRAADLYVNGDYLGSYLVTEKVEVSDAVVDITDLDDLNEAANPGVKIKEQEKCTYGEQAARGNKIWTDIPVSPADISGGYLIEFDRAYYDEEMNGFCTNNGQQVTVKSPANASKEEIDYISGFCNEAEEAMLAEDGYNSLGKHYSDYYDVPSLAKMFILNELLLNSDVSFSSSFFSKERGGKLLSGPAWDFDSCLQENNSSGLFRSDVGTWCTNLLCLNRDNIDTTVFALAFRHEDFRKEAARQWEIYRDLISGEALAEMVHSFSVAVKYSAAADHFRWTPGSFISAEKWMDSYVRNNEKLSQLVEERRGYMDKGLQGNAAMLYYDVNGAYGWVFSETIAVEGECVTVKDMSDEAFLSPVVMEGCSFAGWNTAIDGSGETYQPGEEIILTAPSTVLYAQWNVEE